MEHMTGKEVIKALKEIEDKSKTVFIQYPNCEQKALNAMCSWRGSYNYPTIYSDSFSDIKSLSVEQAIQELEVFFNSIQTGYKGGEYLMDENLRLWADSYGQYRGFGAGLVVDNQNEVVIICEEFEY